VVHLCEDHDYYRKDKQTLRCRKCGISRLYPQKEEVRAKEEQLDLFAPENLHAPHQVR
jgi:hypothetical protein